MEWKTFNLMSKVSESSTRIYSSEIELWSRWTVKICQINGGEGSKFDGRVSRTITRFEMHPRTFVALLSGLESSGYRFSKFKQQGVRLGTFKGIVIYSAEDVEYGYVRAKIRLQDIKEEEEGFGNLTHRQLPSSFGAGWPF